MSEPGAWSSQRRITMVLAVGVVLALFGTQRAMNLGDAAPRQFDAEAGMAISQSVQRAAADVGGQLRAMHVVRSTRKEANRVLFFTAPGGPDEDVYVVEASGAFSQPGAALGEGEPAQRMIVILSASDPTRTLETSVGDSGPGIAVLGDPEALGSRE